MTLALGDIHSKEKVSERPIKVRRSLAFLAKSIDPTENMYQHQLKPYVLATWSQKN